MSSGKQLTKSLAQGKKDIKTIPLAWFYTSSLPNEPPQLLPDFDMPEKEGRGFKRVTNEEAVKKLKTLTADYTFAPDKPKGQSLYDYYLSKSDSDETKQMLLSGNTASQNNFLLNGVFVDKQTAERVSGMTTEEVIEKAKQDQALLVKRKEESAVQAEKEKVSAEEKAKEKAVKDKATSIKKEADGTYSVIQANTGKVLQDGLKTVATALAVGQQISGGSTPSLSGRPDLYATEPTPAEKEAVFGKAFEPFREPLTGTQVTPTVATPEQVAQQQAGTLPNYPTAIGGTYLDGQTFEKLKGLGLTEQDIFRIPDTGQIFLRPGISEQTLVDRNSRTLATTQPTPITPTPTAPTSKAEETAPTEETITSAAEEAVGNKEANAKAGNPTLVVTPEMRAVWLQEAIDELRQNRGIAEIIRNAEFDLGQSLNRLIEDVKFRELGTLNQFRQDFRNQQVSQRERGFLFGGIREQEEKQLADTTNLSLAQQGRGLERGVQDISQGFERTFGTAGSQFGSQGALGVASQLGSVQGVSRVIPGSPIIKAGQATPGFVVSGGQFGSFNREMEEEARRRSLEKQNAFETQFSLARTF